MRLIWLSTERTSIIDLIPLLIGPSKEIYQYAAFCEYANARQELIPMVTLTDSETELLSQLLDVIRDAIEETPGVEMEYANKTKLQKLLYFAIDEFDIPVTYSWYLAGAVVPDRSLGPGSLAGPMSGPQGPSGPSEIAMSDSVVEDTEPTMDSESIASPQAPEPDFKPPQTDASSSAEPETEPSLDPILFTPGGNSSGSPDPSPDLSAYASRDELIEFYLSKIPTVWHQETMRFLQNFYQESAPPAYRYLYIESTHLRTHLAELIETVECHLTDRTPTRSIESLKESVELTISDLHYELRSTDGLAETFELVVEGTNLIEDVLLKLTQLSPSEITPTHLSRLQELKEFFFYYVWKYPCLVISQATATGPSADALRSEQLSELDGFDHRYSAKLEGLRTQLGDAGLLPGPDEYPPLNSGELTETLTDLSAEYFRQ